MFESNSYRRDTSVPMFIFCLHIRMLEMYLMYFKSLSTVMMSPSLPMDIPIRKISADQHSLVCGCFILTLQATSLVNVARSPKKPEDVTV